MSQELKKLSIGFLFDDTLDSNDGVAQQVKRFGEWFSQNGHHVSYLCGETRLKRWAGGQIYSLAKNVSVRFNGNRLSMPAVSRARDINRVLAAKKFDVIHVQMPYSPLMSQRVIRRVYRNSAVVATFHILPSGRLSSWGSRLLGLIQWRSLKKLDQVVSVSSSAAKFAKENFGVDSTIIPNAVDISRFKVANPQKPNSPRIVFLGRLVKRKGCEQLIRAFAILAQTQLQQVELVIAGDGPERSSLEALVSRLGLQDRVRFLGFIDEKDKPGFLASASIACFPSLYGESFGVVLIEAMAAGARVVLAGDNPGYRTVVGERPKLLIEPTDSEALAKRMAELLINKKLAEQLHVWQTQNVKQYDINIVGEQVLDVYRQVIAKRDQKRHN